MLNALFRGLLHLLAFSALCAVGAYWFVHLRAPLAPVVALPTPPVAPLFDSGPQAHLFGGPIVATALSNVQVAGVIAPREGGTGGIAAISIDGKPVRAIRVGQYAAPGLMLVEVHKTRLVFEQNGARAEVALNAPRPAEAGGAQTDGVARTIAEPPPGSDTGITFEGRPQSRRAMPAFGQPAPQSQPAPQMQTAPQMQPAPQPQPAPMRPDIQRGDLQRGDPAGSENRPPRDLPAPRPGQSPDALPPGMPPVSTPDRF